MLHVYVCFFQWSSFQCYMVFQWNSFQCYMVFQWSSFQCYMVIQWSTFHCYMFFQWNSFPYYIWVFNEVDFSAICVFSAVVIFSINGLMVSFTCLQLALKWNNMRKMWSVIVLWFYMNTCDNDIAYTYNSVLQMMTLGWPWPIYGTIKFGPLCFCMGKR